MVVLRRYYINFTITIGGDIVIRVIVGILYFYFYTFERLNECVSILDHIIPSILSRYEKLIILWDVNVSWFSGC